MGWPAVLSEGYWREGYDADPRVLGTTLKIRGAVVTIVGVAPAAFHGVFPGIEPKLYLPLQFMTVMQPHAISSTRRVRRTGSPPSRA